MKNLHRFCLWLALFSLLKTGESQTFEEEDVLNLILNNDEIAEDFKDASVEDDFISEENILELLLNEEENITSELEDPLDDLVSPSDETFVPPKDLEFIQENREVQLTDDSCAETCENTCVLQRKVKKNCLSCECETEGVFEGDILIEGSNYCLLQTHYTALKCKKFLRGALYGGKWTKVSKYVEVPYEIRSGDYGVNELSIIRSAMSSFHSKTCVKFRPRRNADRNYLKIYKGPGCSSYVGRISRPQEVSIGSSCAKKGIVAHELMHALGFWHEQSRPDRDNYITVLTQNIRPQYLRNFKKQTSSRLNTHKTTYDLNSVMHYGGYAFSVQRGTPTIVDKRGQAVKGQRIDLSHTDVKEINIRYNCNGVTSVVGTAPTRPPTAVTSSCRDRNSGCPKVQRHCRFTSIQKLCPKTCQKCQTPTTRPPITTKPPTIVTSTCKDQFKSCPAYEKYCKTYAKIRKYCPKTCKICKSPTTCIDKNKNCPKYENRCGIASVKRVCPKTCKNCEEKTCVDKNQRYCITYKQHCATSITLQRYCRKTCNRCELNTQPIVPPTCKDRSIYCPRYKSRCGFGSIKSLCPKTCSNCEEKKCMDKTDNCKYWGKWCQQNQKVKSNCPKTCGLCSTQNAYAASAQQSKSSLHDFDLVFPPTESPNCQDRSGSGCVLFKTYCSNNLVQTLCSKTCNTCGLPEVKSCEDKLKGCYAFGSFCKSNKNIKLMCPRTCGQCSSEISFTKRTEVKNFKTSGAKINERICGKTKTEYSNGQMFQRIVGGEEVEPDSVPWIVSLSKSGNYFCAGSIISRYHIVTAAHCFGKDDNPLNIDGYAGKHQFKNFENSSEVHFTFSNLSIHSDYDRHTFDYDIAILKISTPLVYSDSIRPICLPATNGKVKRRTEAFVSGWGTTQFEGDHPTTLQQVDVRIISRRKCNKWLNRITELEGRNATRNMICAGYKIGGKDACQGDSGGPLTVQSKRRHTLWGIVSWGYQCASAKSPGVYTKVSKMVPWIKKTIT